MTTDLREQCRTHIAHQAVQCERAMQLLADESHEPTAVELNEQISRRAHEAWILARAVWS